MPGVVSKRKELSLSELKTRGDRAVAGRLEAIRVLQMVVEESHRLRDRINWIHHQRPWSFETHLALHAYERAAGPVFSRMAGE